MTDRPAKPRHGPDKDERAWGAFVLAWFLAVLGAVAGWIMSMLMRMFDHDDD